MPVRIYDIARTLGMPNKEVIARAKELGIANAKVPSSSIDKISAEYLIKELGGPAEEKAPANAEAEGIVVVKKDADTEASQNKKKEEPSSDTNQETVAEEGAQATEPSIKVIHADPEEPQEPAKEAVSESAESEQETDTKEAEETSQVEEAQPIQEAPAEKDQAPTDAAEEDVSDEPQTEKASDEEEKSDY